VKITEVIPNHLLGQMRLDLEEAEGYEVLWVAKLDEKMKVTSLEKVAEGTINAVAIIRPLAESGDAIIHNHPSGNTHPSHQDLLVANQLGEWGVGFFIVDNQLQEIRIVSKPVSVQPLTHLDGEFLSSYLRPGGKLSKRSDFEYRPGQVKLLQHIVSAFNENFVLIAEAGTGIGKSFAYLIPALSWAQKNNERVVITTGTINLQRQILEKDIPRVQELLGTSLRTELVKGRGNYLCPARLNEVMKELDPSSKAIYQEFYEWSQTTATGDKEELSGPIDPVVWSEICSEKEICASYRCGFRDDCFVTKARKRAAAAQILVVNHHLLFADLSLRVEGLGWEANAILPPFRRLVIDEAHKIEESATSYFSDFLSRPRVLRLLRRFYRQKKRKRFGILIALEEYFPPKVSMKTLTNLIAECETELGVAVSGWMSLLNGEPSIWIKEMSQKVKQNLAIPLDTVRKKLLELVILLQKIDQALPERERQQSSGYELHYSIGRLQNLIALMSKIIELYNAENTIYWLERFGEEAKINLTPFELGPFLNEALFTPLQTVTAVSATLSIKGTFDYFMKNSGADLVEPKRLRTQCFESPFPFEDRVLLGVPVDLPPPEQKDSWFMKAIQVTKEALRISKGGALLLFTSYDNLNSAKNQLTPTCRELGLNIYFQGQKSNAEILKNFNKDVDSVLLATYSFWEGVDVPGESLRLLIIFKLPFSVPTDPVRAAKKEYLESLGRNSFLEMSLPEAVIRLKQGFGRLMRRSDDGGVVLVLDSRIVTKSYGSEFLNSLPPAKKSIKNWEEVRTNMIRHYKDLS
jgi:ATP-dependent DNA helicase DinG